MIINGLYMIWMNYIIEPIITTIVVYGILSVMINGNKRTKRNQMRSL